MFYNLLVTLDGSELAEVVLPYVEEVANRFSCRKLILLQVVPPLRYFVEEGIFQMEDTREKLKTDAWGYLQQVRARLQRKGLEVETEVRYGEVADEIIDCAHDRGVDLLAMSTHGYSGIKRWVFGSVAEKVLRGINIPILLIRPEEMK
jgi:nucleotide-binding universal stress UspA family protein